MMPANPSALTSTFACECGFGREDITPPEGIYARNWGAARHDVAVGVHRRLFVSTIAWALPKQSPAVLVAADLGWWRSAEDELFVRERVLANLALPKSQLLISLSHTHAGPSLHRGDAAKAGGALVAPYLDFLVDRMIAAARSALNGLKPARLSWRYGRCDLARNRDLAEPRTGRFIVGCNPDTPADDTLLVGRFDEAATAQTLATVVNYACHPTTLAWDNRRISPDFPGAMREVVEQETGAPCIFLQGASGDLAPAEQYVGETAVADRHGRRLGYAVLSTLEGWSEALQVFDAVVESGAALAVGRIAAAGTSSALRASEEEVPLELKMMPSLEEIERQLRDCPLGPQHERLVRRLALRRNFGDARTMRLPVWVWRLGEAVVLATPSEAYSALQIELRRRFPDRPIMVLNVTNGYVGYLAPRAHYQRDQYSVWASPFAEGSLEKLIDFAASKVAEILHAPAPLSRS